MAKIKEAQIPQEKELEGRQHQKRKYFRNLGKNRHVVAYYRRENLAKSQEGEGGGGGREDPNAI